ncbi:MAG: hypothetical protein ACP5HM_10855 [Anaerolineae bacterium]
MKGQGFNLWSADLVVRFFLVLMVCTLGLGSVAPPVAASSPAGALTPLESLLNADGTLNLETGFTGSLDPSGWRMTYTADGAPRFVPARSQIGPQAAIGADSDWDGSFGDQGVNGSVYALAVDSSGNIYVGGSFTQAGGISANYIAMWDGSGWSTMDGGTNSAVHAIAVDSSDNVYVGGTFQYAGSSGTLFNRIAMWDGSGWQPLGTTTSNGVSGSNPPNVYAIAIDEGAFPVLYVGGDFTSVADKNGSQSANYVAAFDTNPDAWTWSLLGVSTDNGVDDVVNALAMDEGNGRLYVGGVFDNATAPTGYVGGANGLVQWNVASASWAFVGGGLTNSSDVVFALALDAGGGLYIGGNFSQVYNTPANNVAYWDSANWSALGTAASNGTNYEVLALAYDLVNNVLYVGGDFLEVYDASGTTSVLHVARWDGSQWASLSVGTSNGVNDNVYVLKMFGDELLAGGLFLSACGTTVNRLARWDGLDWYAFGHGLDNSIYAVAIDSSGNVYVGGVFSKAGGKTVNNIAMWDGGKWNALGKGTNSHVYALAYDNNYDELYVGGGFTQVTQADGSTLDTIYIARWNTLTQQWGQLGNDTSNGVSGGDVEALLYDAATYSVYVGGGFTQVKDSINGTTSCSRVAAWIPGLGRWSTNASLCSGVSGGTTPTVYALAIDSDGELFVGGDFGLAGGSVTASYVAKWNGSAWSFLADSGGTGTEGTDGPVYALAATGNDVYVGGDFSYAGNDAYVNNVAKWDDSTQNWSYLGGGNGNTTSNGVNGIVRALAVSAGGGYVHVGGAFTTAYTDGSTAVSAGRIAVWNVGSSAWDTYGATGMNGAVRAIAFGGSSYLGGDFGQAGGQPSRYIARFTQIDPNAVEVMGLRAGGSPNLLVIAALLVALFLAVLGMNRRKMLLS